jgi:hypothetical protein
MELIDWNEMSKRLLKAELLKKGITTDQLVELLDRIGIQETKAGILNKISRGTFSAAFLIQCLNAIGCKNFLPEIESFVFHEPMTYYLTKNNKKS